MKRWWFLLLAFSIGLNAGFLYVDLFGKGGYLNRSDRIQPFPHRPAPGPSGPGERPWKPEDPVRLVQGHLHQIAPPLNLSDEQRDGIADILMDILPRIFNQQHELHEARRAVAEQYAIPEMKPEHFLELVHHLNTVQVRLDLLVADAMLREAALLTPEQRREYIKVMPWGRYMGPPGRGGGPGHPDRPPPPPSRGH